MRQLLLILLLSFSFISCKKNSSKNTDLSKDNLEGTVKNTDPVIDFFGDNLEDTSKNTNSSNDIPHNIPENIDALNEDGTTHLVRAIGVGEFEKAETLLEAGANPNIKNTGDVTAIHVLASTNDEHESIEFLPTLLKYKINMNAQDENGNTAFIYALSMSKYQLAEAFLQTGQMDIYIKNNNGDNFLHQFLWADFTNPQAVQLLNTLFSNGGKSLINTGDKNNYTPFFYATIQNIELFKILLSYPETDVNKKEGVESIPPIMNPLNVIYRGIYLTLHPEQDTAPDFEEILRASQSVQILLDPSHNVDLAIQDNNGLSPYDILFSIKEDLPKIPKTSTIYKAFDLIRDVLSILPSNEPPDESPNESQNTFRI